VAQHESELWRLPADLIDQLTAKTLLRAFTWIQVIFEQTPAARRIDAGNVITQLHQPTDLPLQHCQSNFGCHGEESGLRALPIGPEHLQHPMLQPCTPDHLLWKVPETLKLFEAHQTALRNSCF